MGIKIYIREEGLDKTQQERTFGSLVPNDAITSILTF